MPRPSRFPETVRVRLPAGTLDLARRVLGQEPDSVLLRRLVARGLARELGTDDLRQLPCDLLDLIREASEDSVKITLDLPPPGH